MTASLSGVLILVYLVSVLGIVATGLLLRPLRNKGPRRSGNENRASEHGDLLPVRDE